MRGYQNTKANDRDIDMSFPTHRDPLQVSYVVLKRLEVRVAQSSRTVASALPQSCSASLESAAAVVSMMFFKLLSVGETSVGQR